VDRNIIPVSATQVREAILDNNYIAFTKLVPKRMWATYGTLRSRLIEIKGEE
jgi:citrate lyase synthetase